MSMILKKTFIYLPLITFTLIGLYLISFERFINDLKLFRQTGRYPIGALPTQEPKEKNSETVPTPNVLGTETNISMPQCTADCEDCMYFPLSKQNALRQDFSPIVEAISLNGGGMLVKEANEALTKLFTAATEQGLSLRIVSSYRSFQAQESLFESYVIKEINRNKVNRARAEEIANIYSAKAGHSEHQLGTTVDLSCSGCTPFANDSSNQKVYDFLSENSAKYGFIVSYTEANSGLTGYKAEPWHIRYIGMQLAASYYSKYNQLQGNYSLDLFLAENCAV